MQCVINFLHDLLFLAFLGVGKWHFCRNGGFEQNWILVLFSVLEIWKLSKMGRSLSVTSIGINNHRELDFWAEILIFLKFEIRQNFCHT